MTADRTTRQANLEAAALLLERLGLTTDDLQDLSTVSRASVSTFAAYICTIYTAMPAGNTRNCQNLWFGLFQATSVRVVSAGPVDEAGVISRGRSRSLPLWNRAPARTRATSSGALTLRQRAWAASISL